MFKRLFISLTIVVFFISCKKKEIKKERHPYLIEAGQVGKLKKGSKVSDLDSIFALDSIVVHIGEGFGKFDNNDRYLIYDSIGRHLFTLTPTEQHDINSKIRKVQIFDNRFRTKKKLNIQSTFSDIKKNYAISKIETTFNTIAIYIDELNSYFTIDKRELPENIRYDMDTKIDSTSIPDNARIKYYIIIW